MSAQAYSKPTFALLFFGVAVTALVAQLKPTHMLVSSDLPENPTESRALQVSAEIIQPSSITSTKEFSGKAITISNDRTLVATEKLNKLALDFFTTEFNEQAQSAWQFEIDSGSPFLAELGAYLKLDKLYGIELNLEENRRLTNTLKETEGSPLQQPVITLQTFIDEHSEPYWPLNVISRAKSSPHSPHILLNHFDRDFLLKIERANLSASIAPLAPGIERLLKYHLNDAVEKSSGLYRIQRSYNIDNIERDFARYSDSSNDFFEFYNLVLQRNWTEAVQKLQQSDKLSDDSFLFLYDLIAANAPYALLEQGELAQIQARPDWWQQFFYFELCLKNDIAALNQLNQRLSLQFQCLKSPIQTLETIQIVSDSLIGALWEDVLTASKLTNEEIQSFLLTLSPSQQSELFSVNSHTLFDFLARKKRIKIIRNASFYQRIENNYQLWLSITNPYVSDSLYQFSPLFHWFSSNRKTLKQSMVHDWQSLLPRFSEDIQREMAQNLIAHVTAASVNENNWPDFIPLVPFLSSEDTYLLTQLAELTDGFFATQFNETSDLSDGVKQRLRESSFEINFNAQLNQRLDISPDLSTFLNSAEQLMISFANQYPDSLMTDELSEGFDDNGELTDFSRRHFERLWERSQ